MCFTKNSLLLKFFLAAVVFFYLAVLTGCSGDNDKKTSSSSSSSSFSSSSASSSSPYIGQWYAQPYGYHLSVSVEADIFTVKTYSVTKDYCLLQDVASNLSLDKLKKHYVYSNLLKEALLENKGLYPPGIAYEKVKQLPVVCTENLQALKVDSGYTFDARRDFEVFWQTFKELYINFELRGINWDNVYKEAIQSVDSIKNEEELFEFLSLLIAPLGDGHAMLIKAPLGRDLKESIAAALENDETPNFSASTQLTLSEKLINEYVQILEAQGEVAGELTDVQVAAANEYLLTNYLHMVDIIFGYADKNSEIEIRAAGEIAWFKTSDNIGYLTINSMSDYTEGKSTLATDIASDLAIAEATINEALSDLRDTAGIIIDVRVNGGGQDQVALNFVRHFISKPQVVYAKFAGSGNSATPVQEVVLDPQTNNIYLKPTAVLVSGDSASAAELFTIAMASLPQVTIIGEPTAGAFSDILIKRLTSDIMFGVSNETYLDVQGNNYEGIGIPADIAVPFGTLEERKGSYDSGLDTAIDWIKASR